MEYIRDYFLKESPKLTFSKYFLDFYPFKINLRFKINYHTHIIHISLKTLETFDKRIKIVFRYFNFGFIF